MLKSSCCWWLYPTSNSTLAWYETGIYRTMIVGFLVSFWYLAFQRFKKIFLLFCVTRRTVFPDLFSKGSLRFCLKLYNIRAKYVFSHRYSKYSLVLLCYCLLLSAHTQLLLSPWTNHAILPELIKMYPICATFTYNLCIDMLLHCGRNPLPWSKSCQQKLNTKLYQLYSRSSFYI